jgi:hypothetical protein
LCITAMRSPFSSSLVTLLEFIDCSMEVSNISALTLCCKFFNFVVQIFLLFVPETYASSRLTLFDLSPFIWLGFCSHCSLARFLWSDGSEHR